MPSSATSAVASSAPDHAPDDDFWTWREEMYAARRRARPRAIRDVARRCFGQTRAAGYTTVGEFHYVHHRPDGTPYATPNALAEAVCDAAEDAACASCCCSPPTSAAAPACRRPGQRRFCDPTVEAYLERLSALEEWAARRPLVARRRSAPLRARGLGDLARARSRPLRRPGLVLHVHADEQPREIEESLAEHGAAPVELLDARAARSARARRSSTAPIATTPSSP